MVSILLYLSLIDVNSKLCSGGLLEGSVSVEGVGKVSVKQQDSPYTAHGLAVCI